MASLLALALLFLNLLMYYLNGQTLPTTVSPLFYHLVLYPDYNTSLFDGLLDISLNITIDHVYPNLNDPFTLTLNAIEDVITIWNLTIECNTPEIDYIPFSSTSYNSNLQQLTLTFSTISNQMIYDLITADSINDTWNDGCIVNMSYTGHIETDSNKGLYFVNKTSINNNNLNYQYLLTEFRPNYARYAIPSWDEPYFVSSFQIDVIVPKPTMVVSNAGIENITMMPYPNFTCHYISPYTKGIFLQIIRLIFYKTSHNKHTKKKKRKALNVSKYFLIPLN